jgi:hypothetical protein
LENRQAKSGIFIESSIFSNDDEIGELDEDIINKTTKALLTMRFEAKGER